MRLAFPFGLHRSWLAASILFTLASVPLLSTQVLRIPVTNTEELLIWKSYWLGRFHWLVWVAAFLLSVGTLLSNLRAVGTARDKGYGTLAGILLAACLLPMSVPVILLQGRVPDPLVSNALFFMPIFSCSWILHRWIAGRPEAPPGKGRAVIPTLLVATFCFGALGMYFTRTVGPHSGDEGHYLIQATSLYYDGDLDIKNQLAPAATPQVLAARGREYFHISPHSRGEHWYSWHAFGLSLLLAPVVPLGDPGRHLVLGLIAALGCFGMYALCRRLAASHGASLLVTLTFSASVLWGVYSARALPEVFGATLLVWLFWCIAAYADMPWRTVLCATLCSSYLPWVQTRFLPLSAWGAGLFVLRVLITTRESKQRLKALAAFCGPYLAAAALYVYVQLRLFETGLPLPVQDFLLAYPAGAFWSIAGSRGLLYSLPLFAWMLAAQVIWIWWDSRHRLLSAGILGTFLLNTLFSTTNVNYHGGSTLAGRYHLAVAPLLLPACALIYERANRFARWWFLFLGLMSTGILVLTVAFLPNLQKAFATPVEALGAVRPVFRGLLQPYPAGVLGLSSVPATLAGLAFVIVLFSATFMLIRLPGAGCLTGTGLIASVVLAYVIALLYNGTLPALTPVPRETVAARLLALNSDALWFPRQLRSSPTPVFAVSDLFAGRAGQMRTSGITTDEAATKEPGLRIQSRMAPNDWLGRGYRWTTLIDPFEPGRGGRLLRVEGSVSGSVFPVIAIRQGSRTLLEQPLKLVTDQAVVEDLTFQTRGSRAKLYILARLEGGRGSFRITSFRFTPFGPRFEEQGGLLTGGKATWPAPKRMSESGPSAPPSGTPGATDYLTKPFRPAHVRTRVRGWLLRTRAGIVSQAGWRKRATR